MHKMHEIFHSTCTLAKARTCSYWWKTVGVQPLQKTIHFKFKSQDSYESSQVNYPHAEFNIYFIKKWKSISLNQKIFRHKNISFWSKTHLIQLKVNFLPTQIFPNSRLPKPNPILIFHFREKDQFQSASSINLPHPLVTSSLGTIGGNPLGTSLGTSSLHSQPSFEPFQPFKKWFISGDYIHATYSKWFISNTTWRMCTPYTCAL